MLQSFSVTWIDALIVVVPFAVLYVGYVRGVLRTNKKALAFFLYPAVVLTGLTLFAVKFLHI